MLTKKFKFASALLAIIGSFYFTSCDSTPPLSGNQNIVHYSDNIDNKAQEMQKYVIELRKDNYLKYIDIRQESSRVCFYGSLSFAFYDNVVITSCYDSGYSYNSIDKKQIELSCGGYAPWYTYGGYGTYTIDDVCGKVIFWI